MCVMSTFLPEVTSTSTTYVLGTQLWRNKGKGAPLILISNLVLLFFFFLLHYAAEAEAVALFFLPHRRSCVVAVVHVVHNSEQHGSSYACSTQYPHNCQTHGDKNPRITRMTEGWQESGRRPQYLLLQYVHVYVGTLCRPEVLNLFLGPQSTLATLTQK